MGGLGTRGYPHPRRCDKRPVEECAAVNPCHLAARGHLLPGAVTHWRLGDCVATITAVHHGLITVAIDDGAPIDVGIVRQGLLSQLLFECPQCQHLRRCLYVVRGVIGCRGRACLHIDHRSRHTHRRGAARAVNLASKLRQRLGADPTPFGPLPPRPRHHGHARVYDRLVAKLAALESQAMAEFAAVVKMAERRAYGRKRTRR